MGNLKRIKKGAIAQLGERLHGMQEVVGSIPSGSTISFLPLEMLAIVLKGSVVIAGTCSIAIPLSSFETLLLGYGA